MTDHQFDFTLEKPVSIWNQEISFDARGFFTALGKGIANLAVQDYKGAAENGVDIASSVGIQEKGPEVLAWELINTALMTSIAGLLEENSSFIEESTEKLDPEELAETIILSMDSRPIGIDVDFFENPQDLSLLKTLKVPLTDWFMLIGIPEASANAIYLRLKDRFVSELHSEWVNNSAKYNTIKANIVSPFLAAKKEIQQWKRYSLWLQEQANKPVFDEAFGLQQVYVNLRGYYKEKIVTKNEDKELLGEKFERHVVDVHKDIESWVENFDSSIPVKVISGGPGSGKSSFAKVLAADIARKSPGIHVLFIPLQHFDITSDLLSAVDDFIRTVKHLSTNPLDCSYGSQRLLVIFDGLDELAMRGKTASESALEFVNEVDSKFTIFNAQQGLKRQALITGRDIAVQASETKLRKHHQILNLLPYYVNKKEHHKYQDPDGLLTLDQRELWWAKYSEAKGLSNKILPSNLQSFSLEPITSEPLLNYLVALTYLEGNIDFKKDVTLNTIYSSLLQSVHQRQWESSGQHKGACGLDFDDFERVLEEISLAIWHGHGRTATSTEIEKACKANKLTQNLELFKESAKKGLSRLLTAFYFRESDAMLGTDNTFEFTHKSFGEYLISRRIKRQVDIAHRGLVSFDSGSEYAPDEEKTLINWIEICGSSPIDKYIFKFLKNEIGLCTDNVNDWQKTFSRLINRSLRKDLPMTKLQVLSFSDMKYHARNTNEALFAVYASCALATKQRINFIPESETINIGNWLSELSKEINGSSRNTLRQSLCYCDFIGSDFTMTDLTNSDLTGTDFSNSRLVVTMLNGSSGHNCLFDRVNGYRSIFYRVNLSNCSFYRAKLAASDMNGCRIIDSDFSYADLSEAALETSNFENCNFSNAKFTGSNLNHASFDHCNFSGVDFTGLSFSNVSLRNITIDKNTVFNKRQVKYLEPRLVKRYHSLQSKT
ncbi:pentapeptide repeat-containing protein [Vibrio crassostreae]|uniref:pentapeptide repeat-containing protein n=1 Tax=Vibrio crassostreae TaxID=246167 RepID=UPI000F472C8D|nr:pentapeptide repeat-containing protein [Vibrio crassostreae]ROO74914.1 uncharacterized protein YjbI with pentapeptide repeats [Vibrio crassostreae]